jgi:hypothetical protein
LFGRDCIGGAKFGPPYQCGFPTTINNWDVDMEFGLPAQLYSHWKEPCDHVYK